MGVSWRLRSGAQRRPADRRSEADAGSAGMDVGAVSDRTRRQRRRLESALDKPEDDKADGPDQDEQGGTPDAAA